MPLRRARRERRALSRREPAGDARPAGRLPRRSLGRRRRGHGRQESFAKRYGHATRDTVVRFLDGRRRFAQLDRLCVRLARDNARSIREAISSETWEQINKWYLLVREAAASGAILDDPHDFLAAVKEASHLFVGITYLTMTHGEGWHFGRLGASARARRPDEPHRRREAGASSGARARRGRKPRRDPSLGAPPLGERARDVPEALRRVRPDRRVSSSCSSTSSFRGRSATASTTRRSRSAPSPAPRPTRRARSRSDSSGGSPRSTSTRASTRSSGSGSARAARSAPGEAERRRAFDLRHVLRGAPRPRGRGAAPAAHRSGAVAREPAVASAGLARVTRRWEWTRRALRRRASRRLRRGRASPTSVSRRGSSGRPPFGRARCW